MSRQQPDIGRYHVAGILVHVTPIMEREVRSAIECIRGALVHAHVDGKIVATLEGPRSADISDALYIIQRMPGVVSAVLVSEHSEPLESIDEEISRER